MCVLLLYAICSSVSGKHIHLSCKCHFAIVFVVISIVGALVSAVMLLAPLHIVAATVGRLACGVKILNINSN